MKEEQTLAHKKPQSTTAVQLCGQLAAQEDKEGGDSVGWGSTCKEGGDRAGWGSTLGRNMGMITVSKAQRHFQAFQPNSSFSVLIN